MESTESKTLPKILLVSIGLSLAAPIFLITAIVLSLDNQLQSGQAPRASSQAAPQKYAQSFHIIVREKGQNIHIWARNLAGVPDFRQTVEENGKIVSQQLYLGGEKTLYSSQQSAGQELKWEKTGNLEPKDIGLANITAGPAVWALQYGVGDHQVKLQQGNLSVTVKNVNEPIDNIIFQATDNINLD